MSSPSSTEARPQADPDFAAEVRLWPWRTLSVFGAVYAPAWFMRELLRRHEEQAAELEKLRAAYGRLADRVVTQSECLSRRAERKHA